MEELIEFMGSQGVSLPSFPSTNATSVAGILATGTHVSSDVTENLQRSFIDYVHACLKGFSPNDGALSQHLVNVHVINGEGDFREFDLDTTPDHLDLFRAHLGVCGVVIRMTFRVSSNVSRSIVTSCVDDSCCCHRCLLTLS